jgi:hypothetical protein
MASGIGYSSLLFEIYLCPFLCLMATLSALLTLSACLTWIRLNPSTDFCYPTTPLSPDIALNFTEAFQYI